MGVHLEMTPLLRTFATQCLPCSDAERLVFVCFFLSGMRTGASQTDPSFVSLIKLAHTSTDLALLLVSGIRIW